MRNVFKLLAISSLLIPAIAAPDNQAKSLTISAKDRLPAIDFGFTTYDFHSAINVISNDSEQMTDEDKAKLVGEVKRLTPFDIKRQKAQLIQQYNEGLKKAKDYFNVDRILLTNKGVGEYTLNSFESSYDFEQQKLVISSIKLCEQDIELGNFVTLKQKEDCNNAYVAMPEDKAEQIYNYLKKHYNLKLIGNISIANQHKIESCKWNYYQACLQGEVEKFSVKLVTDDKHKKILFEGDVEFK